MLSPLSEDAELEGQLGYVPWLGLSQPPNLCRFTALRQSVLIYKITLRKPTVCMDHYVRDHSFHCYWHVTERCWTLESSCHPFCDRKWMEAWKERRKDFKALLPRQKCEGRRGIVSGPLRSRAPEPVSYTAILGMGWCQIGDNRKL